MGRHRRPARYRSGMYAAVGAAVTGTVTVTSTIAAAAAVHPSTPTPHQGSSTSTETLVLGNASDIQERAAQQDSKAKLAAEKAAAAARAQALAKQQAEMRAALARAAELRKKRQLAAAARYEARASTLAGRILEEVAAQAGKPYVYGADGPGSFDCSGLVMYVMGKLGISLPHSAAAQYGSVRHIPSSQKRPGDLVFVFNGGGGSIGHVAIYAGNGMWWEAAHPGTVVGEHAAWSSDVAYGRVG